ncbi:hypothetical protein HZH68_017100 [Vespula germanica]|uniref:Thioester reductase (TE) domain-containing protein n=1 Tax=Vespula germanica TaxID=30212 RepID=A0A834IZN5_VESGE|nr:hypothetical protein HZH68_017100 [Vespula germanica]
MSNILNQISTRPIERMETRLRWKKGNLLERLFFDGNVIEGCFPNSILDELLESHDQAIRYNECNLNLKQSFICKNALPEPVTWTVRSLYRVFTEKLIWRSRFDGDDIEERQKLFENFNNLIPIQEFYYGESIFIIERTGFIAKLLIEKSLRTGPGMNRIYLLIHSEKGRTLLHNKLIST